MQTDATAALIGRRIAIPRAIAQARIAVVHENSTNAEVDTKMGAAVGAEVCVEMKARRPRRVGWREGGGGKR